MTSPPAHPGPSLADLRRFYTAGGLAEADLTGGWLEQLRAWLDEAVAAGLTEPNAVVLATATSDGVPSARTVLLKGLDERGLVVFTNHTSRKGREVAANPRACLVVPWVDLERQVVVDGRVERVGPSETAAYFRSRPRGSQLGAWTSRQSTVVGSRDDLMRRRAELEERWAGVDVPVPDFWGGLRLVPSAVEFWQGRPDRLHDRLRFRRAAPDAADAWVVERLSP